MRTMAEDARRAERPTGKGTGGRRRAFVVSTLCLVMPFAAGAAPIPLYGAFSKALGLTSHALSVATMFYFLGTLAVILVFGRLSTFVGRRPVIAGDLALTGAGCLMFAFVSSPAGLYASRLVQGLACGLAASCAGAYVVDTAPEEPKWLSGAITASGPQVGFAAGALLAAGMTDALSGDVHVAFLVLAATAAVLAMALLACPETMPRRPGGLSSLVPRIEVAPRALPTLGACAGCFMGAWGMSGFFQTFSSTFAQMSFATTDAVMGALVFCAYMLPGIVGGPLSGRLGSRGAVRLGMAAFAAAIAVVAACAWTRAGVALVIAACVAGVAQALAYAGGVSSILLVTTPEQEAGTLSAVTLVSYLGALAPNVVIGVAGQGWDVQSISLGYAALVCAYLVACLCLTRSRTWPERTRS